MRFFVRPCPATAGPLYCAAHWAISSAFDAHHCSPGRPAHQAVESAKPGCQFRFGGRSNKIDQDSLPAGNRTALALFGDGISSLWTTGGGIRSRCRGLAASWARPAHTIAKRHSPRLAITIHRRAESFEGRSVGNWQYPGVPWDAVAHGPTATAALSLWVEDAESGSQRKCPSAPCPIITLCSV